MIERIIEVYNNWKAYLPYSLSLPDIEDEADKIKKLYSKASELLEEAKIEKVSKKDIQDFLDFLDKEERFYASIYAAGLFVSAIINEFYEKNKIKLKATTPLDAIGAFNKGKEIEIEAKIRKRGAVYSDIAGNGIGFKQRDGKITIRGCAGSYVGAYMEGGSIVIKGSAKAKVGYKMVRGLIIIEGNCESVLAAYGGKIIIKGNCFQISRGLLDKEIVEVKGKIENII